MTTTQAVNTKTAPHRTLAFQTIDDLDAELSRLDAAHAEGTLETTGNWSAGQIFEHLATFWTMSFDGFGFKAPLPLRLFAMLIKKSALKKPPPRGFKLRGSIRVIEPRSEVPFDEGLALLRQQMGRVRAGEKMTHDSPLFGAFTHDQWLGLHLNHCAMHLGFTRYPGAPDA
jgi:hypothetical protein